MKSQKLIIDGVEAQDVQAWEPFDGVSFHMKRRRSRTDRKAAHLKAVAKRRKARKARRK